MFLEDILSIGMLIAMILTLMLGFPVAFTLSGVAIIFAVIGQSLDVFNLSLFGALASRYYGVMTQNVLLAVPLFVFMGIMLERSRIAEELLTTMGECFGRIRGGLGISVVIVGMLLAASTGIVGASVVAMGLLSLPAMLKAGYSKRLACGLICASGSLAQIIPPSIALVILGDALSGISTEIAIRKGNFGGGGVSVLDLFVGAIMPGLLLVGLYLAWVITLAIFKPSSCPPLVEKRTPLGDLLPRTAKVLFPPLFLMVAVLGSILAGIATATEAASFGAAGAMLLTILRGQLSISLLKEVMRATARTSCMVFAILLGATVFSLTFRGLGGDHLIETLLLGLPGGFLTGMLVIMVVIFLLGFILDFIEIVFVVIPIVAPALLMHDVSPVWFGIMLAINLHTSFLTPPFGWALFYLRGIAPPEVRTSDIYVGIIPFVVLQVVALLVVGYFPQLATWLPSLVFK